MNSKTTATRLGSKTIFGPVLCDECTAQAVFNTERDTLTARVVELEGLVSEIDTYLDTNNLTSIGNGSVLHILCKEALGAKS
jgi:hypothetical protein